MQNIEITRIGVNIPALDAQLRAQLASQLYGISVSAGKVIVHLTDTATADDFVTIQTLVSEHNPAQLTAVQIKQKAAQENLQTARSQFTQSLDPDDFRDESASIQTLIERLNWLENEIRDLRGLE